MTARETEPMVPALSVVTVCMNRRDHLLRSAAALSRWPHHSEHLIVDWSSTEPLRREDLPSDPRLRLLRVEGEDRWNLCRAYNFAIARARGSLLLKLDADCWPSQRFDPTAAGLMVALEAPDPVLGADDQTMLCALGSGPEGRKGQFLMARSLLAEVGGYNEVLVGYGFDDKDLAARLVQRLGVEPARIPADWLVVIPHSDEERAEQAPSAGPLGLRRSQGFAAMRASRLANRLLAAQQPWGRRSRASRYLEQPQGVWRLEPGSLPQPSPALQEEVEHARRMSFWGTFLAIPEVFLEQMPFPLLPPARGGPWPVRWWHRLYWYSGRQLLQLPVLALALVREALQLARRRRERR
ncbi:glycosyltransferase family 2 protein [Synechococcus sp. J7-Johnson]|uniref:glycosyltransferase family 2 protein n=1 Tax=Synechococcus sp. J7-Johnson TaxID=2823737 RepID=UPI0020CC8556|nr:glycosyltransferase family A protein [Synechococcus sp. J7-Johnson]